MPIFISVPAAVPCKKIRIRKEVNDLTQYETNVLTQAFKKAIAKKTEGMKFEDIASYHGAPFNVCDGVGVCNRWKIENENEILNNKKNNQTK